MNNGTTCVWASKSKFEESNLYQLVINRPNTTSSLVQTICPFAMQVCRDTRHRLLKEAKYLAEHPQQMCGKWGFL